MADRWLETARKNEMTDGYMRPLVSRGEGPMGISNNDRVEGPNVYVIPQLHREGGIRELSSARARLSSVRSPSPVVRDPRVKANHYLPNILAKMEIADTDATVPIRLDDDGYVTEAAAANVFVVDGGTIRTPDDQQILSGTTRATLLELLEDDDRWEAEVTGLTPYDLYTADECFLTGSIAGVKAITHLNGDPIGDGEIGPVTEAINDLVGTHLVETGTPIR
jgi:branched-chain amino acid aminotransferase